MSQPTTSRGRPRHDAQRGVALIWVAATVLIIGGVVYGGLERLAADRTGSEVRFAGAGQASSVARAGLVDALAWLRRQTTQPVLDFEPRYLPDREIPIDETEEPDVGLVRTFEIAPGVWGRYEVRRGRSMDPFQDLNANGLYDRGEPFYDLSYADEVVPGTPEAEGYEPPPIETDTETPPAHPNLGLVGIRVASDGFDDQRWTPSLWTRDISVERGRDAPGSVWRIESRGMVFRRADMNRPLGEGANRILAQAVLATEVTRLVVSPPAAAAICAPDCRSVTLGARSRVRADSLGIGVGSADGSVTLVSGSELIAPTAYTAFPGYLDSVQDVFGVDWTELKSMADLSTSGGESGAGEMDEYALVVNDGDLAFGPEHTLKGTGILAVRGNLDIAAGSNTFFSGVLYVDGDVTIRAPAYLRGTLICTGSVLLQGSSADYVELEHDASVIDDVLAVMGRYRITRAIYTPDRTLLSQGNTDLSEVDGVQDGVGDDGTGDDGTGDDGTGDDGTGDDGTGDDGTGDDGTGDDGTGDDGTGDDGTGDDDENQTNNGRGWRWTDSRWGRGRRR